LALACSTTAFGLVVPRFQHAAKVSLLAADDGDGDSASPLEKVEAKAVAEPAVPAEDPFNQPKAEAKAAPAAAAAAAPKKAAPAAAKAEDKTDAGDKKLDAAKAEAKADAGDKTPDAAAKPAAKPAPAAKKAVAAKDRDAPAPAMKPPAAAGGEAKAPVAKKAPPPKKEEKHPYYAWQAKKEAGANCKAPAAYYKEKSQYDLGWFGKYEDRKTEAERSAAFLARHDGSGGASEQTRTKERVYAEIAALKEERAARATRARGARGW
jgi:hypothetical protein